MTHRKKIKHFHEPGELHELTFSCYQRRPLLTIDSHLKILAATTQSACQELDARIVAFVFMPEHVHLLMDGLDQETIPRFLARLKQPCSREIKRLLIAEHSPLVDELQVVERPGKTCFRFWQEGPGFDRNLASSRAILNAIDYIHNNPVRRGLCQCPTDWHWSSVRYYLSEPACTQSPDLPFVHGLPVGLLE